METLQIRDLKCEIAGAPGAERIVYLIYPAVVGVSDAFLKRMVEKYKTPVAVVYVPGDQWNNYLTPWPEPPEEKGFPPFGGNAADFGKILVEEVIPRVEKEAGISPGAERDIVGVSLSGLFALWQWMQHDTFKSAAFLSGSFWYDGFLEWFESMPVPKKTGKAYFLLGRQEPKAKIQAYRSVGVNTEKIVDRLGSSGIATTFQWVPGNHFSDPVGRLELAFSHLMSSNM